MGANDFDPFKGMDPDNINYVHSINYDEMRDIMYSLPPGMEALRRQSPKARPASLRPRVHGRNVVEEPEHGQAHEYCGRAGG